MPLVLATLLAAAPIHVISIHSPKSSPALENLKTLSGVTTIDATALHTYLLRTEGMFPMQDFEGFTAAPISEWAAPASAETWKQGVAHCLSVVGPPPWKEGIGATLACANRLSVYLWQQFAAQQKATRVFEIDVFIDERKGNATVRAAVWEPNSRDQLYFDQLGKLTDLDKIVERVVSDLLAKKGKSQARNVISELASALVGDPFTGQAAATTPIAYKKTCAAMPTSLSFTPKGILADSLVARWKPEGAKAAPMDCTLTFNEHTEAGVGEVMTLMTTLMTCSSNIVSAEFAKTPAPKRALVDLVSERLLQGLATKLCK